MRFITEEDLKTFHGSSCIILINRIKGSLDARTFPLCLPRVRLHTENGWLFFWAPRGKADEI